MSLAPNKIIRINDDVGQPSLGIYGNDVDGYKFFQQNSLIDTPKIQTEGEARIQMRQFMLDNSMIEGDFFPIAGTAQFIKRSDITISGRRKLRRNRSGYAP